MSELAKMLLEAPDSQLDAAMKPYIEKWSDPPKAIQILEVLDHCIHGSLANDLVIKALQLFYDQACKVEGVTHAALVPQAVWRNRY